MKRKSLTLRRSFFTVALLATSQIVFAQNPTLKEKKVTLSDDSKITYHVKDQNIKEGPYYIKSAKSGQLLLKGAYTNNERSGNWYFYDEAGKPEMVYSYQQNRLAFIDSGLVNKLTINIPGEDKEVIAKTQIPVLLSSMKLFLSEMSNNIAIPQEHFSGNENLPIRIMAEIDTEGKARYFVLYKHNKKDVAQQVKLKRSAFDIEWIPAMYNKKPIRSEVMINTEINGNAEEGDNFRRFRWSEKQ